MGLPAGSQVLSQRQLSPQPDKMKAVAVLLLVVMAMCAAEAGTLRKRFLLKEIQHALNSVGDFFTKQYNSAKDAVHKVASGLNFDAAVNALVPLIHSDMSVTACVGVCDGAAATVLGAFAPLAHTVCTPLCEGALAKLEDLAS